jgi:hypothetical protein
LEYFGLFWTFCSRFNPLCDGAGEEKASQNMQRVKFYFVVVVVVVVVVAFSYGHAAWHTFTCTEAKAGSLLLAFPQF